MNEKFAVLGTICQSTSGHDRKRYYIIIKTAGEGYVYISDGAYKKVIEPKKKNIRHLTYLGKSADIAEKISNNQTISDEEIKRAIKIFKAK